MEQKQKDSKRFITPSGAGFAVICFFLPWFRACGQDISGSQIASRGESLLWLVLIAAIAIVVGFIFYDGQNKLTKLKPIVIGGAILSLLILPIKFLQIKDQAFGLFEIRYGAFAMLIGFITSLVGLKYLEDPVLVSADKFCTECGAKNSKDSGFCSECGAKIK